MQAAAATGSGGRVTERCLLSDPKIVCVSLAHPDPTSIIDRQQKVQTMSDDISRIWAKEKKRQEREARDRVPARATCLHCGNAFPVTEGVITADAALCEFCSSRD